MDIQAVTCSAPLLILHDGESWGVSEDLETLLATNGYPKWLSLFLEKGKKLTLGSALRDHKSLSNHSSGNFQGPGRHLESLENPHFRGKDSDNRCSLPDANDQRHKVST